ncbi:uncharacterized protein LOC111040716 [Myzus persicae]|uniref:uncharacterized protein LOC111040716 n=1 Tax=Myzus persicae TaxID=13164 RepID=UPI000B9322B6|nr:uncharacterized protein LOC111040716 [Myzus persicae]
MKSKRKVPEQQAPVDYLEDYDEKLVQLNRRLASARTEHHRARDALDDNEANYVGTKERREMVLWENGRLISERQKSADLLVAEKQRLVAEVNSHWAIVDALYESRIVQFQRMLTRLKEDADFVRTRFNTSAQRIENRTIMMDKITRVLENASNLKKKQQEGMYSNRQIFTCSMHKYTEELERYIGNFFETVLIGRSDKLNQQTMQNIKEYYNIVEQFDEYRRKYVSARNDQQLAKLYKQNAKIVKNLKIEQMIKKMLRKKIVVPEKLSIADDLHKEHSSNTIVSQKEDSKHEPPEESDQLGAIIKLKRKLTEDITQQNTEEIESRKWKCNYLKKLFDEIRTIADKAKQYIANQGQPKSYDTADFEWLLNKGEVKQYSTCKIEVIQTYDYDIKLNQKQPYSECNRDNLLM